MDHEKLICRRILDLDPQYDIKKLENSSKQEVENILRRKKQESPKEKVLRNIGRDKNNRIVYKDEVGLFWKQHEGKLYSCLSFHGEPFLPMNEQIICKIYDREEMRQSALSS